MPSLVGVSGINEPSVLSYSIIVNVSPTTNGILSLITTNPWSLNV